MKTPGFLMTFGLATLIVLPLPAQVSPLHSSMLSSRALAANIIVPQARFRPPPPEGTVQVSRIEVAVDIIEQVATTTLDISLTNATGRRLEAEMIVPVPEQAALRGFTFQGGGNEAQAELLTQEEARRLYDAIVAKTRDPALLEFIGCNLVRSSVFPVEARGTQRVRLVYEHLLSADGDRVDYFLPRTESIEYRLPWEITVRIKSKQPIATIYSPSHSLNVSRTGDRDVTVRLAPGAAADPGPFSLSYLLEREGLTASLLAYPDPKVGGGYFLLLGGVPAKPPQHGADGAHNSLKREVILVLDRSGSMAGEKLEQVRAAALQVLEGLEDGEAFNIIVYHEAVEAFAPEPVLKNKQTMQAARAYLRGIRVRGGTNIHDALVEALRMKPVRGCLPMVLFLTDGRPTVGQTAEQAIGEAALRGNRHERRIFTFGVGLDVNTPLLDRLARETRATATFVLPKEDVEVKVAQVFRRLAGPVLADPVLRVDAADGLTGAGRVSDLMPARLPDLFEGDQLVVLGQYRDEDPLHFTLRGNYFGRERTFHFRFGLEKATTKNAFVARLWASRKIAVLTDAIRDLGAEPSLTGAVLTTGDPRMKELVEEIVRLSKEFGILTEYTAFLAREGTDLGRPGLVLEEAQKNFDERALKTRWGTGSVNQEFNNRQQRDQAQVNLRNGYYDANLNRVEISTVQQVNDRAFYKRGNRWVDSQLLAQPAPPPGKVVEVGSSAFFELARRLAAEGRPGCVALDGEILLRVDGETILIRLP